MDELKIEVWGVFSLTKKQILIFEIIFFSFFMLLTVFLFSYDFKIHAGNDSYNFHAKYAKYFSLASTILIIIEAQFLWLKFTQAQLELIEKQKSEILEKNRILHEQKEKIEYQNQSIRDSLSYASKIQNALLPSNKKMERLLSDHFIYYKPRDIVSGDFYWLNEVEDKIVVAAADCTGHGVPGAFVSLLGISFLNEIVKNSEKEKYELKPAKILNELREKLISSIINSENDTETYDGMDISICVIDKNEKTMCFAGALLPIYIVKNSDNDKEIELLQLRGDIFPISMSDFESFSYTNKKVELDEGDIIYMFSDGYADQFGGDKGRKFLSANFKKLIEDIAKDSLEVQRRKLHENILSWRGDLKQVDDIMVLGIKI
ncbi:MAG: SpoIIE family protein phosphatase [Bacteroidales bacterium]|nr:SpoIIE family protein phosphatase [Bacteroidales bacterium]MBN2756778.1 SpoIIE family protein phosphatase [Bacteroidales bacterium]